MSDAGALPVIEKLVRAAPVSDRPVALEQSHAPPASPESQGGRQASQPTAQHRDVRSRLLSWHALAIMRGHEVSDKAPRLPRAPRRLAANPTTIAACVSERHAKVDLISRVPAPLFAGCSKKELGMFANLADLDRIPPRQDADGAKFRARGGGADGLDGA